MAEVPVIAAVSLSRSPVVETPRHPAQFQDGGETLGETSSLKALARRVLDRDTKRDSNRDTAVSTHLAVEAPSETPVSGVSPVSPDDLHERAALIEYGAGVSRAWAEGFAALSSMPAPTGFSSARWQRIIDAAGIFIDKWAAKAAECGWSDLDVFGVDPDAPDRRFDAMGLVLLLDRREIVSIDKDGADLRFADGVMQRYRRKPMPAHTGALWELARCAR
jgi:hypothetical protein